MKKKLCYKIDDLAFDITLHQTGQDFFTVTYGLEIKERLSYLKACSALGSAILHALACDGLLDNA